MTMTDRQIPPPSDEVASIRWMYTECNLTALEIAEYMAISSSRVKMIVHKRSLRKTAGQIARIRKRLPNHRRVKLDAHKNYLPTPEHIEDAKREIQSTWTPKHFAKAWQGPGQAPYDFPVFLDADINLGPRHHCPLYDDSGRGE